jgi:hypothetical protein
VRLVVDALRRTLSRPQGMMSRRDVASSGLQLPQAVSCGLRLVPPSE